MCHNSLAILRRTLCKKHIGKVYHKCLITSLENENGKTRFEINLKRWLALKKSNLLKSRVCKMRFIGCKTLLLDRIKEIIDRRAPKAKTFCDIFSGTATVARYFKQWYEVTSNDLLFFSYVLQKGTVETDTSPDFNGLKCIGIDDPIDYFNNLTDDNLESLPRERRFFQNTYAPTGGRMYLNDKNALRIDYARNTVEDWKNTKRITDSEYYYLVASIIEGIPFVSNISGTYGAFHKKWERRSYKKFELFRLRITTNNKNNRCYNEDGVNLVKKISGDILYIDPPYNARQYLPNYHVLETAAKYDFPEVKGVTAQRANDNCKSKFCQKTNVVSAFDELIKNAKFQHIILSYSTDGLMNINKIEAIMKEYGKPGTFEISRNPYRRFKSNSNSKLVGNLSELLIYVEKEI